MSQGQERIFDLTLLASSQTFQTAHPKLFRLILRLTAIRSALEDVKLSQALCTKIRGVDREIQAKIASGGGYDDHLSAIARDHMISAVIHYMRGTSTTSSTRKHPFSPDCFSPLEARKHELVKAVRNNAVAHFGIGDDELWQQWHKERMLLVSNESGISFDYERRFTNYSAQIVEAIADLSKIVIKNYTDSGNKTQELIYQYMTNEPDTALGGLDITTIRSPMIGEVHPRPEGT